MFSDFRKPFACEATKIRKGERRGKRKTKFFRFDYPEPHPDSWKDSCFWEIYNMFFGKASYVIFVGCVIFFDELCKIFVFMTFIIGKKTTFEAVL